MSFTQLILIGSLILAIILALAVNLAIHVTLMYKRKSKQQMTSELKTKFATDYQDYVNLPTEQVSIQSRDGLQLQASLHVVHPHAQKVVIIHHGYTANRYVGYQFTDLFFAAGYNVLLVDMRSHGLSEGKFISYGHFEADDLDCWVDWLHARFGDTLTIGLHGQSMGAASVMLYAGLHPNRVRFVVEDCGFTSAHAAIQAQFKAAKIPFWPIYPLMRWRVKRRFGFDFEAISPLATIQQAVVPTLFIHGTNDSIVPAWMASELFEAKRGEHDALYLVEGAEHMEAFVSDKARYTQTVHAFLAQLPPQ